MYREMANLWIQALEGPPRQAPQLSTELADWMNNSDDRAAWVADLYAHGNDRDRALHWMGIAIDRGFTNDRWWAEWDPFMVRYREDPEFRALVAKAREIRVSEPV